MARVTVEDCKKVIPDHFELVALASKRGRDIGAGSPILVDRSNDKNAVIALREIAAKKLNIEVLRENFINDFRKSSHMDDNLDDVKKEKYIEVEIEESNQFVGNFEDELSEGMPGIALTTSFEDDDFSFEDDNIDIKD
jgi:DNA-directed RNA polymerase subunit omega